MNQLVLTSQPGSSIIEVDFDRPLWTWQRKLSLKTIHYSSYWIETSRSKRVDKTEVEEYVIAFLYCDIISYSHLNNKKRQLLAVVNLRNIRSISTYEDDRPIFHDIISIPVTQIKCYFETVDGNRITFNQPTVMVFKIS